MLTDELVPALLSKDFASIITWYSLSPYPVQAKQLELVIRRSFKPKAWGKEDEIRNLIGLFLRQLKIGYHQAGFQNWQIGHWLYFPVSMIYVHCKIPPPSFLNNSRMPVFETASKSKSLSLSISAVSKCISKCANRKLFGAQKKREGERFKRSMVARQARI